MPPIPRNQLSILGILLVLLIAAQVGQPYPDMAWMQHMPTLVLILAAPFLLRRWPLSTSAVLCIAAFFALHTLGGRYIYSYVPYDDWARTLFGTGLNEALGWQRNHYDRLVHLAFGALFVWPCAEILARYRSWAWRSALIGAAMFVLAISALYEIFEWLLTLVMGGDAERYNGQQGDPFDAQKDMALAGLGAAFVALSLATRAPRALKSHGSSPTTDTD